MKRVLVVGNPKAHGGRALTIYKNFLEFLAEQSEIEFEGYSTKQCFDETGIENAISGFKPDVISIIGGDGTVNDVINVAFARNCDLHLIPAGSGNDFSKLINGKLTEKASFDLVKTPHRIACDVGICNNRYFLNGVGIGFDGSVARQTVHMKLPFSTSWKYWIAIFRNVLFYKSTPMHLDYDGQLRNDNYFMLSVANGTEYGGGFRVSPESDPCDGLLNLIAIKHLSPMARLRYIPIVEKGKHLKLDIVEHTTLQKIHIESEQVLYAHLDGELMSGKSYDIEVGQKITLLTNRAKS